MRVVGKGEKERVVPLADTAKDAMNAWVSVRNKLDPTDQEQALFLGARGGPS